MACDKCKGSGFLISFDDKGRTIAHECSCRAQMITDIRLRASGISEAFRKKKIEDFKTFDNKSLQEAKSKARGFVDNFLENEETTFNSIMFMGQSGSGKTHLSLAIGNELLANKEVACLYMPYREEMTKLKELISEDKYKYEEEMYKLKTARLLIIDDLYKGSVTEADINYVFQIVNHRYLNNLPFVLSTEKNPRELMNIDEAIASRLIEQAKGNSILLTGTDLNYRLRG